MAECAYCGKEFARQNKTKVGLKRCSITHYFLCACDSQNKTKVGLKLCRRQAGRR